MGLTEGVLKNFEHTHKLDGVKRLCVSFGIDYREGEYVSLL